MSSPSITNADDARIEAIAPDARHRVVNVAPGASNQIAVELADG